ncbi:MAG: radical SAM protein, partial [Dehalococcoidales bacterium]|nr:radical SAM protein [Dehalococcoidales bacterium]
LRRGEPNMLWLNGQDLLLLNNTAAEFVEAFIGVMSSHRDILDAEKFKREIAERMRQKYAGVPVEVLVKDFDNIYGTLLEISKGSCPVSQMSLETRETEPKLWTAPPRMDLALTYSCNNNCYFCYTGGPRKMMELSTAAWKKAIDKLWDSGVPQIVFTGGEPTLRNDLVELVEHSREFVTGLVTNGRKLSSLAGELNRAELDYVQVSLESHLPEVHDRMVGVNGAWKETRDGIAAALKNDLAVITNTTLTRDNLAFFPDQIQFGFDVGLRAMACNTLICSGRGTCRKKDAGVSLEDLKGTLSKALEVAHRVGVKLEWYSPTCYKQFNPIEFGFGVKACSAAQYNMTIEPDGSVIPCQSWFKDKLGDILKDAWPDTWNHPVAAGFREKAYLKGRVECVGCEYLHQCYGGCPLEYSP